MPLWKGLGNTTGGGGGGAGCLIDVSSFPGADLSAKLIAAIAAAPSTGAVLDCRCMTGAQTISSTVVIDKPVEIKFGAAIITCTASPAIHFEHGADPEPGPGTGGGTIVEGAGTNVTKFVIAAGNVGVLIQGDFAMVRDFGISFAGDHANNIGIDCRWEVPTTPHGLLRPWIDNVFIIGGGTLGKGISFSVDFGAEVSRSQIYNFADGVFVANDGNDSSTTIVLNNCRVHSCVDGVHIENGLGLRLHDNILEGNSYAGLHIVDGQDIKSHRDYYEQPGAENIVVDAAPDGFPRNHFIYDATHGGAPGPISVHLMPGSTATQTIYVSGGSGNLGMKAEGSGRIVCDNYYSFNDNNVGNVIEINPRPAIQPTKYRFVGLPTYAYLITGWGAISLDSTTVWNESQAAAVSFIARANTDTPSANESFHIDGTTGFVNIGGSGTLFGKFAVNWSSTDTAAVTRVANYTGYTVTPTAASAGFFTALYGDIVGTGTFDITGLLEGVHGNASWTSATKTASLVRGVTGRVENSSTGVITEAYALYAQVKNNVGGSITYAAGLIVDSLFNNPGAGGTVPNYYNIILYKPNTYLGLTNSYGIFFDDFSGATAAIWVGGGLAHFGGMIRVGGETTGLAGFVSYTNTVDNSANSTGVLTILLKGATNRNSSGFLKILDGTTPRYIPYVDAITG